MGLTKTSTHGGAATALAAGPGFTLVELAVVVAIVAILAALSYTTLKRVGVQATGSNGLSQVESLLRNAREEAFDRGAPVAFFMHPGPGGAPEMGVLIDFNSDFNPGHIGTSIIDPSDRLLYRESVPAGVVLVDSSSSALTQPLPAPFSGVPANAPCTFCPGNALHVVVVFNPDGTAALGETPASFPDGGSFTLEAQDNGQKSLGRLTLAVLSRIGTVAAFER